MSEKNLPPTEARLREARSRGQIGISQELVHWAGFALLVELVFGCEPLWRQALDSSLIEAVQISVPHRLDLALAALQRGIWLLAIIAAAVVVSVLVGTFAQTKFNIATKQLSTGVEKLNVGKNLSQLFSGKKVLMTLIIGPAKIAVIASILWVKASSMAPTVFRVIYLSPENAWTLGVTALHSLLRTGITVMFVLAVFDFALQRFLTKRSLRMSLDEVRRDYKNAEGDPHAKSHRRSLAKEVLNEAPKQDLSGVAAVVTNPTHIAVALEYSFETRKAPKVRSKAVGDEAASMRAAAVELGIPIVRYVRVARVLYATGREGAQIPRNTFRAVAAMLKTLEEVASAGNLRTDTDYEFVGAHGDDLLED